MVLESSVGVAVSRLATAVGPGTSMAEILDSLLDECRSAIDVQRIVAVSRSDAEAEPVVQVAGPAEPLAWSDLDPFLCAKFEEARHLPPPSVSAVHSSGAGGASLGLMATLLGATQTVLWLEYGRPRAVIDDDRVLVAALGGYVGLAVCPPEPLRIEVTATPGRLSGIRSQLGNWLQAAGVFDDLAVDIVLVVNEACTNSIEHGYRARAPGLMIVDAQARGRGICIQISDFGSWKLPDENPRLRGRGVRLMRAVSADMTIAGTSTGTTVTVNFEFA